MDRQWTCYFREPYYSRVNRATAHHSNRFNKSIGSFPTALHSKDHRPRIYEDHRSDAKMPEMLSRVDGAPRCRGGSPAAALPGVYRAAGLHCEHYGLNQRAAFNDYKLEPHQH